MKTTARAPRLREGMLLPALRARDQLVQQHGLKPACIDADVELALERLEPAMAVAMQIDRAAMNAVPGAEWIMAEHQPDALQRQLRIGLHARPFERAHRR